MALIVPGTGETIMLNLILNKTTQESLVLHLYTNNYTPVTASVVGSFTEASGYGYVAPTLAPSVWTVSGSAPATATSTSQTFIFTGALGAVYGYYVTGATSGTLYWAERISNTPTVQNNGDQIVLTINFGLN